MVLMLLKVQELAENENPWTVFVETADVESSQKGLVAFDKDCESDNRPVREKTHKWL